MSIPPDSLCSRWKASQCIFRPVRGSRRALVGLVASLILTLASTALGGSQYDVLHRFRPTGKPGVTPYDLVADGAGNFYGTTSTGGKFGYGTVYELSPPSGPGEPWTTDVIYSFPSGWDFFKTAAGGSLIFDRQGNLYGVTAYGGKGCGGDGCGTVFKLTPPETPGGKWTRTNIFVFAGWNGYEPWGLTFDQDGHLYGATRGGGRYCGGLGCGLIYKLIPDPGRGHWRMKVLYYFTGVLGSGDGDGANPYSLAFNDKSVLYGLASGGGHCDDDGCYGAAFQLTAPEPGVTRWTEKILFRFRYYQPYSGLTLGGPGILYGSNENSVYQLVRNQGTWTQNILTSGNYLLYGDIVLDQAGNLYSTSLFGGDYDRGTVFKLSPPTEPSGNWKETILHSFAGGRDGDGPEKGVVFGIDGALYGTTIRAGNLHECGIYDVTGCGIVFRVVP